MRGQLVVFEGLDRSGKSTQCQKLVDALKGEGKDVVLMRFPNRSTPSGHMIGSYLSGESNQEDHVIHLLFTANRWEAARDIREHIEAGRTVVVDRYYYSGCVYTAAKQDPTMDLAWCRHPEVGLPRPDLCFFLDISTENAAKRGGFGTERYEQVEMQDRVRRLFAELRTHDDEREDIVVIDAGADMDDVHLAIRHALTSRISDLDALRMPPLRNVRSWVTLAEESSQRP